MTPWRQLLCHFECALAIAARGLHADGDFSLTRIGVGYDGEPESQSALAWAVRLAAASGAELRVRAVVDDRMPRVGWGQVWMREVAQDWMETVREEQDSLRSRAEGDARGLGVQIEAEAVAGPARRRGTVPLRRGRSAGDRLAARGPRAAGAAREHR